ncbi:putative T7SS-secreted protein [Nocardioides sp. NPDC057767]|uniref:putative T7SS-secreted protein n=1 Tax=unclassified Nocardioides TaxID=2615069 RepID=UPI0036728332
MPDFTIKGNPGEIRSRGQTCADKGRLFDQTGDALTKIDTQGWIGRAADNFRDAHDREPNRWYEAGTGFRAAGNALIDYAAALEVAQRNAATAKSEYERGEGVTTQAKSDYAEYSSRFDRARSDALAGGMTYPYTKEPFTDPGAEIRSGAMEMFETAKSDVKLAAARCAREVRVGCKDAPEKRNWFESGLAFVGGIFEGAGEAVWDLVKMGYNMGPLHDIIEFATGDLTAEELAAQKSMMLEDAEALWEALKKDPLEFGKQLGKGLLDWDTWADDPARAIGHLVPDIVAGVLTGGTGTVATRGVKGGADALDALGDMTKALRGVDNLDGLGDIGKLDNAIDDLGDLGKVDEIPTAREYQMMDGTVHKTDFAPEQLGSNRAAIDAVLERHGTDRDSIINLINKPTSQLTDAETSLLRNVRDDMPLPEKGTVIQKVIGQPSFDKDGNLIQAGADDYILGNRPNFDVQQVRGSVAMADDVAHLGTPEEIRRGLRLDYDGTPFQEGDASTHVLRFRTDEVADLEVPRNADMGGSTKFDGWTDPFTGNGFTKATDDVVPELYSNGVQMREGAEMWEILDNGNQRLVAVLQDKVWVPQGN